MPNRRRAPAVRRRLHDDSILLHQSRFIHWERNQGMTSFSHNALCLTPKSMRKRRLALSLSGGVVARARVNSGSACVAKGAAYSGSERARWGRRHFAGSYSMINAGKRAADQARKIRGQRGDADAYVPPLAYPSRLIVCAKRGGLRACCSVRNDLRPTVDQEDDLYEAGCC